MQYNFQWTPAFKAVPGLLEGALTTLEIAVISMVMAVVLAVLLALCKESKNRLLKTVGDAWVGLARNTPALFQIYMIYFGLGSLGLRIDSKPALIIAITFNSAGYLTEAFRSGLKSISETQTRAGRSLGLSSSQVFIWILLPQLMRIVFYPITNQFVWSILMTSLGVIVGLDDDLMGVTQFLNATTYRTFEYFVFAAILYYALAKIVTISARAMGARLFRY